MIDGLASIIMAASRDDSEDAAESSCVLCGLLHGESDSVCRYCHAEIAAQVMGVRPRYVMAPTVRTLSACADGDVRMAMSHVYSSRTMRSLHDERSAAQRTDTHVKTHEDDSTE